MKGYNEINKNGDNKKTPTLFYYDQAGNGFMCDLESMRGMCFMCKRYLY